MYLESKHTGDDASIGEELLIGVSELEERARVVEKAVKEGYFTLDRALSLYKVSEIEYLTYSLVKNKKRLEATSKQLQVIGAVSMIVSLFNEASIKFDPKIKKMMHQLETITNDPSFKKVKVTS
jgi:uncharacterized small protein (DUF1192 family)